MTIPEETLTAIRNELPNGAQEDIAKETGYSSTYVNLILNGKREINPGNSKIILAAQRTIRNNRDAEEKLLSDLEKTVKDLNAE
jgi:transcriptional regulator with XRE-family HTH domain